MSLVYLTFHNENIHDLDRVNDDDDETMKSQKFKYKSKFNETIKNESKQPRLIPTADGKKLLTSSGKYDHRTMGWPRTPLQLPSEFMRKNGGIKWLRQRDHICVKEKHLPPVPQNSARPETSILSKKEEPRNFIALNIDRIKQLQPKRPIPRYVDTPNGDRHNLQNTGLTLQYVKSKKYGKTPCYLHTQKKKKVQQQQEQEWRTNTRNTDTNIFGARKLSDEERESIIEGLKSNFMEQTKIFQRLSLYTDTQAKKQRKARIENVLRQLEQDIYLMEKNPIIYVTDY